METVTVFIRVSPTSESVYKNDLTHLERTNQYKVAVPGQPVDMPGSRYKFALTPAVYASGEINPYLITLTNLETGIAVTGPPWPASEADRLIEVAREIYYRQNGEALIKAALMVALPVEQLPDYCGCTEDAA